jgi:hypothetical protein
VRLSIIKPLSYNGITLALYTKDERSIRSRGSQLKIIPPRRYKVKKLLAAIFAACLVFVGLASPAMASGIDSTPQHRITCDLKPYKPSDWLDITHSRRVGGKVEWTCKTSSGVVEGLDEMTMKVCVQKKEDSSSVYKDWGICNHQTWEDGENPPGKGTMWDDSGCLKDKIYRMWGYLEGKHDGYYNNITKFSAGQYIDCIIPPGKHTGHFGPTLDDGSLVIAPNDESGVTGKDWERSSGKDWEKAVHRPTVSG